MELFLDALREDSKLEAFYKKNLENLAERAPSDAFVCSCIEKKGHEYAGTLRVFSPEEDFAAKVSSGKVGEVVKGLLIQMNQQIARWRTHRFDAVSGKQRLDYKERSRRECMEMCGEKCTSFLCPVTQLLLDRKTAPV